MQISELIILSASQINEVFYPMKNFKLAFMDVWIPMLNYDSSATISDFSCLYLNLNGISPNYAAQGDTIIPVISSNYTISDALLSNSFDTLQINNLETSFDTLTNFFGLYVLYNLSKFI